MSDCDHLIVRFIESEAVLTPGRDLVFGRGAELDIDCNPFLHRNVGRFVSHGGLWWLENVGSWISLTVTAEGSSALVRSRSSVPLIEASSTIRFEAGCCTYEITASVSPRSLVVVRPPQVSSDLLDTARPAELPLNDEQRLLVVALAEARLRDPFVRRRLPTNAELALRLGWTPAKFNRKLDWLCQRLNNAGVSGMRSASSRANDRRERLVDHMIGAGHVTVADLALLDGLQTRVVAPDRPAASSRKDSRSSEGSSSIAAGID